MSSLADRLGGPAQWITRKLRYAPLRVWLVVKMLIGFPGYWRVLGGRDAVSYTSRAIREVLRLAGRRPYQLRSNRLTHPVLCRPRSSDIAVFRQVLIERHYRCADDLEDPKVIIDCGANVGYASAYFLSRFPGARLIAIEPDPGTFQTLQSNLAPYGDRASCVLGGVWSRPANLMFDRAVERVEGQEWALVVRECRPGEPTELRGFDLPSLMHDHNAHRISILKMDIEGSEREIFEADVSGWIDLVDNIFIELHDDACHRAFHRAVAPDPSEIEQCGEILSFKRRPRSVVEA